MPSSPAVADTKPLLESLQQFMQESIAAFSQADFYLELICAGVALAVSLLLDSLAKRALKRNAWRQEKHPWIFALLRFLRGLVAPLALLILLAIAKAVAQKFVGSTGFLIALSKVAVAWLVARALLHAITSRFVAFLYGAAIIIVTILSVAGLLASTQELLDSLSFEMGKVHISAFIALKGIMLLILLTWLVNNITHTLERYLLRQPGLNGSSRELVTKLTRIVLFFTAFLFTMNAVGIDLTALAVFGGALGVGIGFGLQKITANFISGIILLFERSVRIGDFIEIGTDSGWVRQMAVRYTLIELADGREAMVPNEQLMTSRVVNWTYQNSRSRLDITVPVDYQGNATLARKLMLEAASEHPSAMKDPAPNCFLREFKDSGMVFLLTVWLEDLREGRFKMQSQIMFSIMEKFQAHDIRVTAPPREIYVQPRPQDIEARDEGEGG